MIPYIFNPTVKAVTDASGAILGQATSRALPHATYCEVTEELNGEFSLAMGYPAKEFDEILTEGHANGIVDLIIAANINKGQNGYWEPFRIFQYEKRDGIYEISARHITYDLSWVVVANPNSSPRQGWGSVSAMLNGFSSAWSAAGFTLYTSEPLSIPYEQRVFPQTVRDMINDIFLAPERGAAEMTPNGWTIQFSSHRGSANGLTLNDGVNADVKSVKVIGENTINAVAPYITIPMPDDNGDSFFLSSTIQASAAASEETKPVVRDFTKELGDTNMTKTEADLRALATNWINGNRQSAQVSIEVVIYDDVTIRNVGDTFNIIAPRQGMARYNGRLLKLSYDVLMERPTSAYFDAVRYGVGDVIWTRRT